MNLKVLPHETKWRFLFLFVLAAAVAMDVADRLSWHVFLYAIDRGRDQCRAAGVLLADLDTCMRQLTRARLLWDLAVAFGTIALGVAVVLAASLVRRRGLVPVPPQALGDLVSASDPRIPLLWKPPGRVALARADGIRRPYVEVGVGFMSLTTKNPAAARASLRHEYAHHALGDVVRARICLGLPWTLVAMVLIVLALPQPATWRPVMMGTAPRTLLLVALMFLARASFLRAREIAADNEARAPCPDDLVAFLEGAADSPWWRRPFASHPTRAWRQDAVRDPAAACRITVSDGIALGLVAAACTTGITQVLVVWSDHQQSVANSLTAAHVWGLLGGALGAWVAAMVMRVVAASRFGVRVSPAGFAIGLGMGLAVGGFVLLGQPGTPGITFGLITWAASALLGATAIALVGWIWGVAQWWLNLEIAERGATWSEHGVLLIGAVTGASLLGAAGYVQAQAWSVGDVAARFLVRRAYDGASGFDVLAVLVVAGVPWWLLRRPRRKLGGVPGWLSNSPRTDAVPDAPMIRLDLRTATIGGLIATGAYATAAVVWARATPPPASWFAALIEGETVLLAPSAVLAATVVCLAIQAGSSRLAAAMVPACLAAVVVSLGIVLFRTAITGHLDGWGARDVLINLAVGGVLGGLVLTAVVLTFAGAARHLRWLGRRSSLIAIPVLAGIAGVALVAEASQLRPSPVFDLSQVGWVHQTVNRDSADARSQCRGEPVTPQGVSQASAAVARLHQRSANPVTAEVRRAHLRRLGMWEACAAAISVALGEGRATVTSEQRKQFVITDGATVWLRQPSLCEIWADLDAPKMPVTCH